jgi:hypothetical protein
MTPENPDSIPNLIIGMILAAWPVGLVLAWIFKRRLAERYERLGESTEEEMLGELATAYGTRRRIEIHTPTEYLPFVFEGIREVTDSGFDDKQMRSLLERIDHHRPHDFRQAVFPIETGGRSSDLLFQWSRDEGDRIRLRITAAPRIIRALREQKKKIPKAALAR